MSTLTSELYRHRSATREFLFSPSDEGRGDATEVCRSATPDGSGTSWVDPRFPEMRDRQGLIAAIDTDMADATTLVAVAVGLHWNGANQTDEVPTPDWPETALAPLAACCRSHGGSWGRIGHDRFALVFPHGQGSDGQRLAGELLKAYPQDHPLTVTLGLALFPTLNFSRSQVVENAEKALDHGGFLGPRTITCLDAVSFNISGDRHYQAGDIAGAMAEYRNGLLLDPLDANLHNSLGVCHGVLNEDDLALEAFENAIWLDSRQIMPLYNKGFVLLRKGRRTEALACFQAADAMEADVFEVVFHLGQIHLEMDAPEAARPYLEAATRANRRSAAAHKSLGACLDRLGLTKEAIQAYTTAVKINPADALSLSTLGRLYNRRGDSLEVAAAFCEQSVRLDPDNGHFRHGLGEVYLNQEKLAAAQAEFERAIALGHDSRQQAETVRHRLQATKAG